VRSPREQGFSVPTGSIVDGGARDGGELVGRPAQLEVAQHQPDAPVVGDRGGCNQD
jgi:hypothetical protein